MKQLIMKYYWKFKYRNLDIEKYIEEITEYKNGMKCIDFSNMNKYLAARIIDHIEKEYKDRG